MYSRKKIIPSNRSRILECIYRNAPVARTEIAKITGITPATVTNTAAQLIDDGIITEIGEAAPKEMSSGRKRILLDIVPSCFYAIGAEFTREALTACICDMKGNICFEKTLSFPDGICGPVAARIIDTIEEIVKNSRLDWNRFVGIGIALPGQIDADGNPLIAGRRIWKQFRPGELYQHFPVPVAMENHVRCIALGAYLFLPNRIPDSFSLFHAGSGMFCATMLDGELFTGRHNAAGEIGHTTAREHGPLCECGKRGCLQVYSSEPHIVAAARTIYRDSPGTALRSLADRAEDISLEHVLTAYQMDDPAVKALINDALRCLSISIANIIIILNPGKIFMHGRLFSRESIWTARKEYVDRQLAVVGESYHASIESMPCSPSDGARGGCALAVSRFFL